jgi:alpha-1,6-mannosyltransferase
MTAWPRFPLLVIAGVSLCLLTGAGLALHRAGDLDLGDGIRLQAFVAIEMAGVAIYLVAVTRLLPRLPERRSLIVVVAVAAIMRLMVLPAAPFLSSDIYRYVWDGVVQDHGISPYRYVPADPALASLRDAAIFPRINRATYARTIYPPAAQLLFGAVAAVSPTVFAMKLAITGFEALAIGIAAALLGFGGRPASGIAVYAWSPVSVWEFAGNGHIDAVAIFCLGLALLAVWRGHRMMIGAALGAAVLVKLLPAVVAPAYWRVRDGGRAWVVPVTVIAVIVAGYAIYLGKAGAGVLGFLPGYSTEEGLLSGAGFFAVELIKRVAPSAADWTGYYIGAAAASLLAIALWLSLSRALPDDPVLRLQRAAVGALVLTVLLTVLLSPHYPWYFPWIAYFACWWPALSVLWLSGAAPLLRLDGSHTSVLWPAVVYLPFGALLVRDLLRARSHAARS